jgi:hypothetical protein
VVAVLAAKAVAVQRIVGVALRRNIDAEQSEAGGSLSGRTNDTLTDSTLNEVALDAPLTDALGPIETAAFHGNGHAGQSNCILSQRTLKFLPQTAAVELDLSQGVGTGETPSSGGVEGEALIGDVEAGVVQLPLPLAAGHRLPDAGPVHEVVVGGVGAGLTIPRKQIICTAINTNIITLPKVKILPVGTGSVADTSSSCFIQSVPIDAAETGLSNFVIVNASTAFLGARTCASLGNTIVVDISRVVKTGILISLPGKVNNICTKPRGWQG